MVGANGSNQTAKVDTTGLAFDASTSTLTLGSGTGGSITGANSISASYLTLSNTMVFGVADALTAAGTVQADALTLTTAINNVTTVGSGTGVKLPTAIGGLLVIVRNGGANALNVYPNTSDTINAAGANVAYSLSVGATLQFIAMNATNWYVMNSTYA